MPELTPDALQDLATAPLSTVTDGLTITERPIADVLAAKKEIEKAAAVAGTNPQGGAVSGWRSLRPARVVPPGGA